MYVCLQYVNGTSFVNVMDFCQSLNPKKGAQDETLEIVDESGWWIASGYMFYTLILFGYAEESHLFFTINAEILVRSLANFHRQ